MSFTSEDMLRSLWCGSTYQFHVPQNLGTDGYYQISAFKTTSFLQVRRCPLPMGRGLSDIALESSLTSFSIVAESIKNPTLVLLSQYVNYIILAIRRQPHSLFERWSKSFGGWTPHRRTFIPTLSHVRARGFCCFS